MAKYAAHDKFSIYAIADSADAAIAKARDDAREPDARFDTAKVSDELAAWIDENGWDGNRRSFDVRGGYIIDTTDRGLKYVIFDLNGMVAFYDHAEDRQDAINRLAKEDESYSGIDELRVHALDADECELMDEWIDRGQKTHLWPFDWRAS